MIEYYYVRVWPDGTQQDIVETPFTHKSDDYEVRQTMLCQTCDQELQVEYGEPFASCDCGTQEWYS